MCALLLSSCSEHWDILLELRVALGSLGRAQLCPEQGCAWRCVCGVGSVTPWGPPRLQVTAVPAMPRVTGALREGSL